MHSEVKDGVSGCVCLAEDEDSRPPAREISVDRDSTRNYREAIVTKPTNEPDQVLS